MYVRKHDQPLPAPCPAVLGMDVFSVTSAAHRIQIRKKKCAKEKKKKS